jgi:hypothetical protein
MPNKQRWLMKVFSSIHKLVIGRRMLFCYFIFYFLFWIKFEWTKQYSASCEMILKYSMCNVFSSNLSDYYNYNYHKLSLLILICSKLFSKKNILYLNCGAVCWSEKSWVKVVFADLLWEKNIVDWQKKRLMTQANGFHE